MRPRPLQTAAALLGLLAASTGVAACSVGESDEDAVTAVIERALTTADPANCEEIASDKFIDQVYNGDLDACKRNAEGGDPGESVEVSGLVIEAATAKASATVNGGENDGQTLRVTLVKEEGDWLVDDATAGSGANRFTALFFEGVRNQAERAGEDADCVEAALRESVTPSELAALGAGERPGAITKKTKAARAKCRGGAGAGNDG